MSNLFKHLVSLLEGIFLYLTQPTRHSTALSSLTDLTRSRFQLIAENAFLRQQLITLRVQRQIKKPRFAQSERLWLVWLANRIRNWKDVLLILKPETLLRGHRQGFRLFWKFKSRNHGGRPKLATETISLI